MNPDNYYLVFDIKTLVYVVDNHALIYNTLTGESIEIINNQYLADLLSQSVCKLTVSDLRRHDLNKMIEKIQVFKVGKLVNSSLFGDIPLNAMSYQPISTIRNNKKVDIRNLGEYYKDFLKIDTTFFLYINSECEFNCIFCNNGFKQFACCTSPNSNYTKSELSLYEIKEFLRLPIYLPEKILIVSGGNIFKHSQFNEIVSFLNLLPNITKYVVNCRHIDLSIDLSVICEDSSWVEIIISTDIPFAQIKKAKKILDRTKIEYSFIFIVSSDHDIEATEIIVNKLHIRRYELKPYYTGSNIKFFEENFFQEKEAILSEKIDFAKVLRNRFLNDNFFSNLVLTSNRELYSNLNSKLVGVLNDDWSDINTEIEKQGSWFLNRSEIEPCNKCIYALLCPSPGNYENVIGRNNLCNVKLNIFRTE